MLKMLFVKAKKKYLRKYFIILYHAFMNSLMYVLSFFHAPFFTMNIRLKMSIIYFIIPPNELKQTKKNACKLPKSEINKQIKINRAIFLFFVIKRKTQEMQTKQISQLISTHF